MPVRTFDNNRITGGVSNGFFTDLLENGVTTNLSGDNSIVITADGIEITASKNYVDINDGSNGSHGLGVRSGATATGTMDYDLFPGLPAGATINSVRWVYDWSYTISCDVTRSGATCAAVVRQFIFGKETHAGSAVDVNSDSASASVSNSGTYDVTDDYTGSPLSYAAFISQYSSLSLSFFGAFAAAPNDYLLTLETIPVGSSVSTLSYDISATITNFRLDVDYTDPDAVFYLVPETEEINGQEVIIWTPVELDIDDEPPEDAEGPYTTLPDLEWWSFPGDVELEFIFIYTYLAPGPGWSFGDIPPPYGWWRSLEEFAGGAILVTGGVPRRPRTFEEIEDYATGAAFHLGGSPGCAVNFNNRIIYARGQYTGSPTIGVYDGLSDRTLQSLPLTTSAATPIAIMSMIAANGVIYLTSLDSGSNSSNWAGRVFELNPLAASLEIVGAPFTGGQLPYCLTWHNGRLWCGTNPGDGTPGKVYWFRPGVDSVWTEDFSLDDDSSAPLGGVCSMVSYGGKLYVGTSDNAGGSGVILARDTAGTYSVSRTGSGVADNNGFLAMIPFQDNLYATYFSAASDSTSLIAEIHKYDGSSWSTVYSGDDKPYIGIYEASGSLFVIGGGANTPVLLLRSDDGTTWDDVTVFLPTEDTEVVGIPVFAEIRT